MPIMYESRGLTASGKCSRHVESDESDVTIVIQYSVGKLGRNVPDDVITIQDALNRVPITQGRPQPLLATDGLNGPNTERGIYQFQVKHFSASHADARVDPNHRTIARLNDLQPTQSPSTSLGSAHSTASFVPTSKKDDEVLTQVEAGLMRGIGWTFHARAVLNDATAHTHGKKETKEHYDLVDRCFKIKSLESSAARTAMDKIVTIFFRMPLARTRKTPFLVKETKKCTTDEGHSVFARAYMGGFHSTKPKHKPVYICTGNMDGKGTDFMADAMVHELAHYCGPLTGADRIDHGGGANPAYGLAALKLEHSAAMISASNYAWLAWLARLPKSQWQTNTG